LEDLTKRRLTDLSDEELMVGYQRSVERGVGLEYSPRDFWEELSRRNQNRNARIMAWWTGAIAIATLVNVGATLYQILRSVGYLQ
jgi:hypothetical protein